MIDRWDQLIDTDASTTLAMVHLLCPTAGVLCSKTDRCGQCGTFQPKILGAIYSK